MSDELTAGVIGVGLLGSAVARRWLAAGGRLVVFDRDTNKIDALVALGATRAGSVQDVFERCRRVGLALPHSTISRQVLAQVTAPMPRTVVMDMTTGDPEEMSAIGRECAAAGITYLDTTVGGSSAQVAAGEAIVMAGGDAEALEACRHLLQLFAKRVFFLGAAGSGARMKLVLNLVLGLNRAVLAEGLAFAQACGLDAAAALEILRAGPACSAVMDSKGAKMLQGDFSPQARLAQHRKDVDLILQESARHSARTPLSVLHRTLLVELEQAGFGAEDNSAIVRAFHKS